MRSSRSPARRILGTTSAAPWFLVLGFTVSAHAAVRDVTSFGAVPNDGTSDSAAIAAAVAASQTGDTVFFPAGTYLVTDAIRPRSGTSVVGAGRDATIVRYTGTALLPLVELADQSDVEVAALTLDGGGNANAENGIHGANGSGHRLHDLTIRDLVKGAGFGPHGIYFSAGVTDSEIRDNVITDVAPTSAWGAGMRLSRGSSRNAVLRNVIAVTGRGGVLTDNGSLDLVIRGNVVTGSGVGLGIEIFGGCDRAIVEDNAIDHWLSIDTSDYCAVRRNVVSDTTGTVKVIGVELAGGNADVFSDNVVDDGAETGVSVSSPLPKDNILWAHNTIRRMSIWGVQLQGQSGEATHHYFYDNAFLLTRKDDAFGSPQGHGFRMNGNCVAVTLDANRMVANGGDGIQFSGGNLDQLSFIGNTIADNAGASVSADPGSADLLWAGNIVQRNGTDAQLTSRGFAGQAPVASFQVTGSASVGSTVAFVNASSAPGGAIVRTLWDLGDGLPSTDADPTHVYRTPGIYRVSLVVWDDKGRGALAERLLQVAASPASPCAQVDCTASGDQCSYPGCSDSLAACAGTPKPAGTACEDGLFCTVADRCANGSCSGGAPRDCSDGDPCTTDACEEDQATCLHTPIAHCGTQNASQQRCVNSLGQGYAKLAAVVTEVGAGCVRAAAAGGLASGQTARSCLTDDPLGKIAAAAGMVRLTSEQRCTCPDCMLPDFGYPTDLQAAIGALEVASRAATTDIFGTADDLGIVAARADPASARCQWTVQRDATKLGRAHWKSFLRCMKRGLAGGAFVLGSDLAGCIGDDPRGTLARAREHLAADVSARCAAAGVSLDIFEGPCGMLSDPLAFAACVAAAVESRTAESVRSAHGL